MARAGPKKTRQYGVAFKRTAVLLSRRPGIEVQAVAEALDIHPFMLSRWRKESREGRLPDDGPAETGAESSARARDSATAGLGARASAAPGRA